MLTGPRVGGLLRRSGSPDTGGGTVWTTIGAALGAIAALAQILQWVENSQWLRRVRMTHTVLTSIFNLALLAVIMLGSWRVSVLENRMTTMVLPPPPTPSQTSLGMILKAPKGIQSESPKRPPELKVYFGTSEARRATFIVPLKDNSFSLPILRIQNSGGSDAPSPRTRLWFSEPMDNPGFGWQQVPGITKGSEFYIGGPGVPPIGAGETFAGPAFAARLLSAATEIDATVTVFYGAEKPAKDEFKLIPQR